MVKCCQSLAQPPLRRTAPYQLSEFAYSIYSQLPYISGGHFEFQSIHLIETYVTCPHDIYGLKQWTILFFEAPLYTCGYVISPQGASSYNQHQTLYGAVANYSTFS
jgi:hypothetical protein